MVDLHVCDRLPLVHGNKPAVLSATTAAKINDELVLVTTHLLEHRVQPRLAEMTVGEEV